MKTQNSTVQFLSFKDGLSEIHNSISPILEKTLDYPESNERLVARVYNDGTLYYLQEEDLDNPNPHWIKISTLTDKGVSKLNFTISKCYKIRQEDIAFRDSDSGIINWKIKKGDAVVVEFNVPISSDSSLKDFIELDEIINTYVQKMD